MSEMQYFFSIRSNFNLKVITTEGYRNAWLEKLGLAAAKKEPRIVIALFHRL